MKTLILVLLLVIAVYGQYQPDTMQVRVTIPAPQEVIDQVVTLECFFQEKSRGQMKLKN